MKLRGYRIEVGEIEAALLSHPEVSEAVVMPRQTPGGETRLVAYYVPMPESAPESAELRAFLRERMPDYMIPSAFLSLAALPLNENGKLNRRALSAMAIDTSELKKGEWAAPRNETEQTLARIWREVLELERVGIHDNFFDLGGHSLLATRVISRVNDAFQIDFPLRQLFEMPTIATLAEAVEAARRDDAKALGPAIVRVARQVVTLPMDAE